MFGLVVSNQGCTNRFDTRPAVTIAHLRQYVWIALSANDGADDPHARGAGDVGDNVVQLEVHEGQRLLHVLDVRSRVVQMPLSEPQIGPQRGDVTTQSEARAQQSAGVQALQPLR